MTGFLAGLGAGLETFGKGMVQKAILEGEEKKQFALEELRAQRAREERQSEQTFQKEMKGEEYAWREGMAEKEHALSLELSDRSHKQALERQSQSHGLQVRLEQMRAGRESGEIKEYISDADGKVYGMTRTGQKVDTGITSAKKPGAERKVSRVDVDEQGNAQIVFQDGTVAPAGYKKAQTAKTGASGGRSNTTMELIDETARQIARAEGREEPSPQDWLKAQMRVKGGKSGEPEGWGVEAEIKARKDLSAAYGLDGIINPAERKRVEEQINADLARLKSEKVPASEAVATEQQAGNTPSGSGTEASPYTITTQEQLDWFKANAKPNAVAIINGQPYAKE